MKPFTFQTTPNVLFEAGGSLCPSSAPGASCS